MTAHSDVRKLSSEDRTRIVQAVLCNEHGVLTEAGELFLLVIEAPTTARSTEPPLPNSMDALIGGAIRKAFRDGQNDIIQQIRKEAEIKIGEKKT